MIPTAPRGIPARLAAKIKARVRYWIDGPQIQYYDTPGQRITWKYPSWAPVKIFEAVPGEGETIKIGAYCAIHYSAVIFQGGIHHFDWVGLAHVHVEDGEWVNHPDKIQSNGPVEIGSDVFIGFEAVISSGVTIGDGAVVYARSMVVKSVEPYSVVGGNPAKHIRYRFDEPTRAALLRIKWWDWPTDKVAEHQHQIHSDDVSGFVARHDPDLGPPTCELCQA